MKLSFSATVLPVLVSYVAYTSAYPVQFVDAADLVTREAFPADNEVFVRSEFVDDLAARGLMDKLPLLKKKQRTEAEEAEHRQRKIWKAQNELNKQLNKHLAKVAQIESGGKANHHVEAKWKAGAPHEVELGEVAHKKAQKYWAQNVEMQKFKHVEVSAKRKQDGTIWTTARYHHNDGNVGGTVHMFTPP